jgi:hypothetical protein
MPPSHFLASRPTRRVQLHFGVQVDAFGAQREGHEGQGGSQNDKNRRKITQIIPKITIFAFLSINL